MHCAESTNTHQEETNYTQGELRTRTKLRVLSFVEEYLFADFLHNDVPRVDWARAAHDRRKNGIRRKHIALSLS